MTSAVTIVKGTPPSRPTKRRVAFTSNRNSLVYVLDTINNELMSYRAYLTPYVILAESDGELIALASHRPVLSCYNRCDYLSTDSCQEGSP